MIDATRLLHLMHRYHDLLLQPACNRHRPLYVSQSGSPPGLRSLTFHSLSQYLWISIAPLPLRVLTSAVTEYCWYLINGQLGGAEEEEKPQRVGGAPPKPITLEKLSWHGN